MMVLALSSTLGWLEPELGQWIITNSQILNIDEPLGRVGLCCTAVCTSHENSRPLGFMSRREALGLPTDTEEEKAIAKYKICNYHNRNVISTTPPSKVSGSFLKRNGVFFTNFVFSA